MHVGEGGGYVYGRLLMFGVVYDLLRIKKAVLTPLSFIHNHDGKR
jgi:hypothetical protein